MKRAFFAMMLASVSMLTLPVGGARAAGMATAKVPDKPLAAEMPFVQQVTADLNARFPTPSAAEKGGYFRYNNEDDTGAISYANLQWNSATDPAHPQPSQLWYDVKGHLLGADFSVPLADEATTPRLWGLNAQRWFKFGHPHVHYVLKNADGSLSYGHAVSGKAFAAAGGNLQDPQAATLVKMDKAKSAAEIDKVFTFPAQWDVEVWLTPNPLGAFAEKNPLVHPSKAAAKAEE